MSEPHEHVSAQPDWLREWIRQVAQISVPPDFTGGIRVNYAGGEFKNVNLDLTSEKK